MTEGYGCCPRKTVSLHGAKKLLQDHAVRAAAGVLQQATRLALPDNTSCRGSHFPKKQTQRNTLEWRIPKHGGSPDLAVMFDNVTPDTTTSRALTGEDFTPDSVRSRVLTGESATLAVATVALSLSAVVSNSLLVYVVVRTASLHTSTNVFIASLSVAEFLTGLLVVPFAGVASASLSSSSSPSPSLSSSSTSSSTGSWPLSAGVCCFVAAVGVLGRCAATLSLVVVSADRCVAISKPLRYASIVTRRSTVAVLVVVWLQSFLMAVLPLGRWGRYAYSDIFGVCLMRSSSTAEDVVDAQVGPGSEVLVKETLCTFLPAGVVLLLMVVTVHRIRGHRRVFAIVPVPVAATSLPAGATSVVTSTSASTFKAMRSLLLVTLAFFALCLPCAVACVMCQTRLTCTVPVRALRALIWLSFLCCSINPILIMALNRKFRAALRALLCCGSCRLLRTLTGADKDLFALSAGLQTVMETTLVVNMVQGAGRRDANLWRQIIMTQKTRHDMVVSLAPRSVGILTLRKTRSTPECANLGSIHM